MEIAKIHNNGSLVGFEASDFTSDGIRIQGAGFASVEFCGVNDTCAANDIRIAEEAHRDAIQLIPQDSRPRSQFGAAIARNIIVQNNNLNSCGKLQGIFSSDGGYQNLIIRNNKIDTNSQWKISINGFISGWVEGNTDSDGKPVHVNFEPLRIGGNGIGQSLYVSSFDGLDYAPLNEIMPESEIQYCTDSRRVKHKDGAVYLSNFRLKEFYEKTKGFDKLDINALYSGAEFNEAQKMAYHYQVVAMTCGEVY